MRVWGEAVVTQQRRSLASTGQPWRALVIGALALGAAALAPTGVMAAATTTTLTTTPNPSNYGQPVTLTARIKALGSGAPTGTVTFRNGPDELGLPATVKTVGVGNPLAAGSIHTCALTEAGASSVGGTTSTASSATRRTSRVPLPIRFRWT